MRTSSRTILGVFDAESSTPVDGAEVIDLFIDDVYRTGPSGLVGLSALHQRNDSVAVRIRKLGDADSAFAVLVGARDTVPVSVCLRKQVTLSTVVTDAIASKPLTVHQAEFEIRLYDKSLNGRLLTRAELVNQSARLIVDVIHELMAGKPRGCDAPPILHIDGIRAPLGDAGINRRPAADYECVGFYTGAAAPPRFGGTQEATSMSTGSMAPAQSAAATGTALDGVSPSGSASGMRGSSSCGVLVLWQRESP